MWIIFLETYLRSILTQLQYHSVGVFMQTFMHWFMQTSVRGTIYVDTWLQFNKHVHWCDSQNYLSIQTHAVPASPRQMTRYPKLSDTHAFICNTSTHSHAQKHLPNIQKTSAKIDGRSSRSSWKNNQGENVQFIVFLGQIPKSTLQGVCLL